MTENEIKLKIKDDKELRSFIAQLKLLGAVKEFCAKQITYRFDTENKDLEKNNVFLRTRTGEKNTLTVKKKTSTMKKNVKSREELEINLATPGQILILNQMFTALGYHLCRIMEKYRMQWKLNNCKIALDELAIGLYAEIEGDEKNIFKILKKIKLQNKKPILDTYWGLFEKFKKSNNLKKQKNIKFDKKYQSKLLSLS